MKVQKRKVSCEYYFLSLGRLKPSKFHHVLSYIGENVAGIFLVISSGILKKFSILIYLGDRDLGKNLPGTDKDCHCIKEAGGTPELPGSTKKATFPAPLSLCHCWQESRQGFRTVSYRLPPPFHPGSIHYEWTFLVMSPMSINLHEKFSTQVIPPFPNQSPQLCSLCLPVLRRSDI